MPITPFAPTAAACCSIWANASARVFSQSSENSVMSPPTSVCSEAPIVPKTDRDRTVTPRTTPSVFAVRYPSIVKAVVVIAGSIALMRALSELLRHRSPLLLLLEEVELRLEQMIPELHD